MGSSLEEGEIYTKPSETRQGVNLESLSMVTDHTIQCT
jgi:hypothetical protein